MNILTFDVEEWFHLLDNDSTRTETQWKIMRCVSTKIWIGYSVFLKIPILAQPFLLSDGLPNLSGYCKKIAENMRLVVIR